MNIALATVIVSSAGPVIVAIFGMYFMTNEVGRRIDGSNRRIDDVNLTLRGFRSEFNVFRDGVNGRMASIHLKIAKLMDRGIGS